MLSRRSEQTLVSVMQAKIAGDSINVLSRRAKRIIVRMTRRMDYEMISKQALLFSNAWGAAAVSTSVDADAR